MKRFTRLLSLLSFSGGPATQDLWSSPGIDEKKVDRLMNFKNIKKSRQKILGMHLNILCSSTKVLVRKNFF
jgi:hypothetical protein